MTAMAKNFLVRASGNSPTLFEDLDEDQQEAIEKQGKKLYKQGLAGPVDQAPYMVILDENGKLVAGLWTDQIRHPKVGPLETFDIVVSSKAQKQGLGSSLLSKYIEDAKERDLSAIGGDPSSSGGLAILNKFHFQQIPSYREYVLEL